MKKRTVLSRLIAPPLCLAMLVTALSGCAPTGTNESTPPSAGPAASPELTAAPSPAGQDGYIPAPYTAGSEMPTEYVEPVFYQNDGGPAISVT